jgi:hypothetical protein
LEIGENSRENCKKLVSSEKLEDSVTIQHRIVQQAPKEIFDQDVYLLSVDKSKLLPILRSLKFFAGHA